MRHEKYTLGIIFAFFAALSNATIGLFTNIGMKNSLNPDKIAFYRCLIALIVTTIFITIFKNGLRLSLKSFLKLSLCSSFGVFTLYFFETLSYQYTSVANVTFMLMGASAVLTFLISGIFFIESMTLARWIGLCVVLIGISLMLFTEKIQLVSWLGALFAITAGFGYSIFLLLTRKFSVKANLGTLWYFFLTGSIYLSIPCIIRGDFEIPVNGIPSLLFLGLIPTLGGFYFTTKALSYIEASRTQLFEMSEPIFASLMALMVLGQKISFFQTMGGLLILLGLYVAERKFLVRNNIPNFSID